VQGYRYWKVEPIIQKDMAYNIMLQGFFLCHTACKQRRTPPSKPNWKEPRNTEWQARMTIKQEQQVPEYKDVTSHKHVTPQQIPTAF
jgi:hypothetical protein